MQSCYICFTYGKDEKNPTYIAPQLLPEEKPIPVINRQKDKAIESLHWVYQYPFLHSNLIQQFISRAGALSQEETLWKNGVLFHYGDSLVSVEMKELKASVIDCQDNPYSEVIYIQTYGPQQEELLNRVKKEFGEHIHQGMVIQPTVFCSLDGAKFVNLSDLQKNKKEGIEQMRTCCDSSVKVEDYALFLRKPAEKEHPNNRPNEANRETGTITELVQQQAFSVKPKLPKVFISYAHEDEAIKKEVRKSLLAFEVAKQIKVFDDRDSLPGGEVDETLIEQQLKKCDLMILLVSFSSLTSDYIMNKELPVALELKESKGIRILPICIDTIPNFSVLPFGGLIATPNDAMGIKDFADKKEAWQQINEAIKRVVNDLT